MTNIALLTPALITRIQSQVRINWYGNHGILHWARVYEIGMKLAKQTGANSEVVQLFALFHDARRHNEHSDPDHGPRGAELAMQLWKPFFPTLGSTEFTLLHQACCLHTIAESHDDITVQTCFDADRLDLGRVGKVVDPKYLCTEAARDGRTVAWAYASSTSGEVPDNVLGRFLLQDK